MNASVKLNVSSSLEHIDVRGNVKVAGKPVQLQFDLLPDYGPVYDGTQKYEFSRSLWERLHLCRLIHKSLSDLLLDVNLLVDTARLSKREWYSLNDVEHICYTDGAKGSPNLDERDIKRNDILYARTHFPDMLTQMLEDEDYLLADRITASAILEVLNLTTPVSDKSVGWEIYPFDFFVPGKPVKGKKVSSEPGIVRKVTILRSKRKLR